MVSWSDWGKTHYCTLWYRFISACQGVQFSPLFNFPRYLRSAGFAFVFDGASIAKRTSTGARGMQVTALSNLCYLLVVVP